MDLREDSIIFLLGAGASVDAGVIHAQQMTEDIEKKVNNHSEFIRFKNLYNYLKSSIIYQRGLSGNFINSNATIEDLLNVLFELKQKDKNILYPFIGTWNIHLLNVAGDDFDDILELDKKVRDELFSWVNIDRYDKSRYFGGLGQLAKEIGSPLRVFTLNYDLCVERALEKQSIVIELGFDDDGYWEATRFDKDNETDKTGAEIYLYKLHGSIDWVRDEENGNTLKKCETPQSKPELIFGSTTKLSSLDPYLFYVHEFRKYSLLEPLRLIVTVGYSFSDDYVNHLIKQALDRNKLLKILIVSPNSEALTERVINKLGIEQHRIIANSTTAKDFFINNMTAEYFSDHFNYPTDLPF